MITLPDDIERLVQCPDCNIWGLAETPCDDCGEPLPEAGSAAASMSDTGGLMGKLTAVLANLEYAHDTSERDDLPDEVREAALQDALGEMKEDLVKLGLAPKEVRDAYEAGEDER
jgi:hypothetical protein